MLGFPKPIDPDDERLQDHGTTYQASRGGWYPAEEKPVPGTPQQGERAS